MLLRVLLSLNAQVEVPEVAFTLRAAVQGRESFKFEYLASRFGDLTYADSIDCFDATSRTPFQSISLRDFDLVIADYIDRSDYLYMVDVNRDGYGDLRVLNTAGAHPANRWFAWYLWNPSDHQFVLNPEYANCDDVPDRDGCCFQHRYDGGVGCFFRDTTFCPVNGELTLVRSQSQQPDYPNKCLVRTTGEFRDNEWVETVARQCDREIWEDPEQCHRW